MKCRVSATTLINGRKFVKDTTVMLVEHNGKWLCHCKHGLIPVPAESIGTTFIKDEKCLKAQK